MTRHAPPAPPCQVDQGADGHPEVLAPPLTLLREDIVLKPELTGNLVPQQVSDKGLCLSYHRTT